MKISADKVTKFTKEFIRELEQKKSDLIQKKHEPGISEVLKEIDRAIELFSDAAKKYKENRPKTPLEKKRTFSLKAENVLKPSNDENVMFGYDRIKMEPIRSNNLKSNSNLSNDRAGKKLKIKGLKGKDFDARILGFSIKEQGRYLYFESKPGYYGVIDLISEKDRIQANTYLLKLENRLNSGQNAVKRRPNVPFSDVKRI